MALGVVGAVADHRYRGRGGIGSNNKDKMLFGIAAFLCIGMVVFAGMVAGAEVAGSTAPLLMALLLVLWEFGRWRIRRKYPVEVQSSRDGNQAAIDDYPKKGTIYTDAEIRAFRDRGLM